MNGKEKIINSYWELLEQKSYNKITVQNIVENCHVNRNTFYYHFQDIPSLTEETIQEWVDHIIIENYEFGTPSTCIMPVVQEFVKRKTAFRHLYFSSQRDIFIKQLNQVTEHTIRTYIEQTSKHIGLSKQNQEIIIRLYKCLSMGMFLDWIEDETSYDLLAFTSQVCQVFEGFDQEMFERIKKIEK